tara:strand:- start:180 stop:386 length:207 start_codon:yes stop_codon:yes gene_type:complete
MAELINNLKNKSVEELNEALGEFSNENNNAKTFIDIDGNAYVIPKRVYDLIDALATQLEKLKAEVNGL